MMPISIYKWIAISGGVLTVILAWRLWNWAWLRPKRVERYLRQQGLKGTSYKPLFGDIKEMVMMTKEANSKPISVSDDIVPRVLPFIDKAINIHGKNCFTWMGPRPMLHIMDPDLIRDLLTRINQFQKPRGENPLARLLAKGLVDTEGEQWVKHRKIITPAFHVEKLKHMAPVFSLCCDEMIDKWEGMLVEGGDCELDVVPDIVTLTRDVISRTAFGSSYEEGRKMFELQKEQAKLTMEVAFSFYVPGLEFLPTRSNKRIKEIYKEVKVLTQSIIENRLKAMGAGKPSNDDLLGILLERNNMEIREKGNMESAGMSIDEVIEECKLFYVAGQETTSVLLVWTLVLLSQHASWQERARHEVFQVFGKRKPDNDGLNHLKIVTMIIQEVMRLYPPVATQSRMVHEESKLGDLTLPANTLILIHTLLVQHDKDIWGADSKEFKPERFAEGMSNASKGQLSYFPFSWGPRVCIGQNFGMLEVKMVLAMILQHFSFTLSPSYSHAPHAIITLEPQYGAHLILRKI